MKYPFYRLTIVALICAFLSACATSPPSDVNDVCEIFREKSGWYKDAKKSRARWDAPISVMMAIMHQESRFVATAKPPRQKIWGIIPGLDPPMPMATPRLRMQPGSGTREARVAMEPTGMISVMRLTLLAGITT